MQQELDEFAEFFDGPLSQEEQELIKQLKARESEVEREIKETNVTRNKRYQDTNEAQDVD
jgi:hypothetical protein